MDAAITGRFATRGRQLLQLTRNPLVRNIAALYGLQLAGYIVPLITLPLLARALGPEEYGRVSMMHSFALWATLVVEYGFNMSATREVARSRDDPAALGRIVAGVLGAKCALAGVVSLIVLAVVSLPNFRGYPVHVFGAWLLAVVNGMTPFWYFQGMERMLGASTINVACRFAGVIGLFALIRSPRDGWLVLLIYAASTFLANGINYMQLYREVRFRLPKGREILRSLRDGFAMFMVVLPGNALAVANTFVMGLFAGPVAVAFFAAAERVVRPVVSLMWPVTQALLPHVSAVARTNKEHARRVVLASLAYSFGLSCMLALVLYAGAPAIVDAVFGPGYGPSVGVLRTLVWLLPVSAVVNALGYQWLIPMGYERRLSVYYFAAVIGVVGLAALFVPGWGALGMAVSAVAAEGLVAAGIVVSALAARAGIKR